MSARMIRGIRWLGEVGKATTMFLLFYLQKWILAVTDPLRIALLLQNRTGRRNNRKISYEV